MSCTNEGAKKSRHMKARWRLKIALSALATVGSVAYTANARADLLRPGQSLNINQRFNSDGNEHALIFQADGNLVLVRKDGRVTFATGTRGSGAVTAIMQHDGNFVVYTADGRPVWSTGTHGPNRVFGLDYMGRLVVVQPGKRGNFELYMKARTVGELTATAGGVFAWYTPPIWLLR
jgi:hypothetical protein